MKATGIVRRIDDLGRVVIPKEIRRTLRIREGDPLEIFVDREGEVILKKYSPIGELGDFAQEYADSLQQSTGHIAIITDRDAVVAVAGAPKKQWLDREVTPEIERAMNNRKSFVLPGTRDRQRRTDDDERWHFTSAAVAPIIAEGDPIGACSSPPKSRESKWDNWSSSWLRPQQGFSRGRWSSSHQPQVTRGLPNSSDASPRDGLRLVLFVRGSSLNGPGVLPPLGLVPQGVHFREAHLV